MSNILKSIIIWNGEHTKASKLQRLHLTRLPSYCFNWSGSELILSLSAVYMHCFQRYNQRWIYYLVGIWMSHLHYNLLMNLLPRWILSLTVLLYQSQWWSCSSSLPIQWVKDQPYPNLAKLSPLIFLRVCSVQSSSFSSY